MKGSSVSAKASIFESLATNDPSQQPKKHVRTRIHNPPERKSNPKENVSLSLPYYSSPPVLLPEPENTMAAYDFPVISSGFDFTSTVGRRYAAPDSFSDDSDAEIPSALAAYGCPAVDSESESDSDSESGSDEQRYTVPDAQNYDYPDSNTGRPYTVTDVHNYNYSDSEDEGLTEKMSAAVKYGAPQGMEDSEDEASLSDESSVPPFALPPHDSDDEDLCGVTQYMPDPISDSDFTEDDYYERYTMPEMQNYNYSDSETEDEEQKFDVEEVDIESEEYVNAFKKAPSLVTSSSLPRDKTGRDWNSEFRMLLSRAPSAEKFEKLSQLASDFAYCAEVYGRIIISEVEVDDKYKTIAPVNVGGIAGGEKFIVQNILFKFTLDWNNLYGGDEFSAKAAAAEHRGVGSIYECSSEIIKIPLTALIDYRGFRLAAFSLLPISRKTIVYGSDDGAKTVHKDNDQFNRAMKALAKKLNLKEHEVRDKILCAPGDVEGHKGMDGNFYLVDAARLFPPEALYFTETKTKPTERGVHLYRFLRPELVKRNPVPLSSDSFSRFQSPNEARANNREVQQATGNLYAVIIPEFVEALKKCEDIKTFTESVQAHKLHRKGINLRLLGRVRRLFPEEGGTELEAKFRDILLVHILARVLKNLMRHELRNRVREIKIAAQEPYLELAIDFFNKILGNKKNIVEESKRFWNVLLKRETLKRFKRSLSKKEASLEFDLQGKMKPYLPLLFDHLQQLTGVTLTKQANKLISAENGPNTAVLVGPDIIEMKVRVKQLNVVYSALAEALIMKGQEKVAVGKKEEARRLWDLAEESLILSIRTAINSQDAHLKLADLLIEQSRFSDNSKQMNELLRRANSHFCNAMQQSELDSVEHLPKKILAKWGYALSSWACCKEDPNERDMTLSLAAKLYASLIINKQQKTDAKGMRVFEELVVGPAIVQQRQQLASLLRIATLEVPETRKICRYIKGFVSKLATSAFLGKGKIKCGTGLNLYTKTGSVDKKSLDVILKSVFVCLTDLNLGNCSMDGESLVALKIPRHCRKLTKINFVGCSGFGLEPLLQFFQDCNACGLNLTYVKLPEVEGDLAKSNSVKAFLEKTFPDIKVFISVQIKQAGAKKFVSSQQVEQQEAYEIISQRLVNMGVTADSGHTVEISRDMLGLRLDQLLVGLDSLNPQQKKERLIAYALRSDPEDKTPKKQDARALEKLLSDPIDDVRVWAMVCAGLTHEESISTAMIKTIQSGESDRFVREAFCASAASLKSSACVPTLIELFRNDVISNVRMSSSASLKAIGGSVVEYLFSNLDVLAEEKRALLAAN